jgi:hypothetical protein
VVEAGAGGASVSRGNDDKDGALEVERGTKVTGSSGADKEAVAEGSPELGDNVLAVVEDDRVTEASERLSAGKLDVADGETET